MEPNWLILSFLNLRIFHQIHHHALHQIFLQDNFLMELILKIFLVKNNVRPICLFQVLLVEHNVYHHIEGLVYWLFFLQKTQTFKLSVTLINFFCSGSIMHFLWINYRLEKQFQHQIFLNIFSLCVSFIAKCNFSHISSNFFGKKCH